MEIERSQASATVISDDFKGLRHLAEVTGPNFARGIVLYTRNRVTPFAANLHAVPVSSLWRLKKQNHGFLKTHKPVSILLAGFV